MNLPSFDFTNWREHPSDNRYQVFFFKTQPEAIHFESQLKNGAFWYEFHESDDDGDYKYYFAVKNTDLNQIKHLNHLTLGAFRKPFLGSTIIKYAMVSFMFVVMAIAIISYFKWNG